ncbi:MAG: 30S ribosomal protein S17 [Dehalococcoidia bacterium]|nr:30S ribosomal protein S17 [Dehalococcoidia bacterium]MBL7166022.1 30S ribosomal protein S17 [Dehalococcoidales bacterium]
MQRKRKIKFGRVVSNSMDKTAVVTVETFRHHPVYRKTIRRVVRYKAHDGKNECGLGDTVRLEETRPLSKEKRWRVVEIITKGEVVEVTPVELETQTEEPVLEPEEIVAESEPEETNEEESTG